ncbi:heme NO-binding domain-containing protein [Paracoccus sp. CPCC 101403]|uniref:Heme NO-binding domain-containing protein n=2 Tax=Paracoccus broussonetiae TaxID=3075834 RepID=A0ABU3EGG9_9RHOB|nr:heme NO-binding domain-containing protein [Paracoccus sp. CPCC 101403]MDT1063342.1 heme NO-binding domain-containing protein [Paracoccus sp. CPCC 101403]
MLGMLDRSLEAFLRDCHGDEAWRDILAAANIRPEEFLSSAFTGRSRIRRIVLIAARKLGKAPEDILEDLGAWLVQIEPIRRLLRFSGTSYGDFVLSLGELPARAGMILADMPEFGLAVVQKGQGGFAILSRRLPPGWLNVLAGALRGMADDYGTLALISVNGEAILLSIALEGHAASRPFALSFGEAQ